MDRTENYTLETYPSGNAIDSVQSRHMRKTASHNIVKSQINGGDLQTASPDPSLNEVVCFKMAGRNPIRSTRKSMSKKLSPAPQPASFEEAMAELDQLVAQMEAGELPLEASVAAYKRGSELVKYCAAQLEKIDRQVKVLEGDLLKPFASEILEANE